MNKKQITTSILAVILGATTVVGSGCFKRKPSSEQVYDSTVAHLNVNNYNGGYGSEWLYAVEKRFEEAYKEYEFIDGTKGVDIHINNHKSSGKELLNALNTQTDDVFFTTQGQYYSAAVSGKLLDITDVVTENLSEKYGEDKTIISKYTDTQKAFFTVNEKVYAIPHYAGYFGITYDIDVFENNNFYYADVPTSNTGLITSKDQKRSKGPDGEYNTDDDGLPTTYDELFALCDVMIKRSVTPFGYAGSPAIRQDYLHCFLSALQVDAEGYDQAMLNCSFDGTATMLVKNITSDSMGKITSIEYEDPTKIEPSNGYLLSKQASKAYALSFMKRMTSNAKYIDSSITTDSVGHTDSQYRYLLSALDNKPIAFFIEGNYWENEAKDAGSYAMLESKGDKALPENRHFGWLPLPKPTADWAVQGATLYDLHNSFSFIHGNIDKNKIELAKTFLQFCNTDESLVEFTLTTNTAKGLKYTMKQEDIDKMSTLGRSVLTLLNKESTKVLYPYSTTKLFLNNQGSLSFKDSWMSIVGTATKNCAIDAFKKDKVSTTDYFLGLEKVRTADYWERLYGKDF